MYLKVFIHQNPNSLKSKNETSLLIAILSAFSHQKCLLLSKLYPPVALKLSAYIKNLCIGIGSINYDVSTRDFENLISTFSY